QKDLRGYSSELHRGNAGGRFLRRSRFRAGSRPVNRSSPTKPDRGGKKSIRNKRPWEQKEEKGGRESIPNSVVWNSTPSPSPPYPAAESVPRSNHSASPFLSNRANRRWPR